MQYTYTLCNIHVHCTVYNVHCTVYNVHCTLLNVCGKTYRIRNKKMQHASIQNIKIHVH